MFHHEPVNERLLDHVITSIKEKGDPQIVMIEVLPHVLMSKGIAEMRIRYAHGENDLIGPIYNPDYIRLLLEHMIKEFALSPMTSVEIAEEMPTMRLLGDRLNKDVFIYRSRKEATYAISTDNH